MCVYVLQSAGNEHRSLAIHRLSQKTQTSAPLSSIPVACSCWTPHKTHYVRTREAQTSPAATTWLTQLLNRDSTADMSTSDFCQTRPQVRSETSPTRSLLPLYGMRLNVISVPSVKTVRPAFHTPIFTTLALCADVWHRASVAAPWTLTYSTPRRAATFTVPIFMKLTFTAAICIHCCCCCCWILSKSVEKCSKLTDALM